MKKKLKSLPFSGYDNKDVMDIRTLVKSIKFSCNDLAIARQRMSKAGYTNFSTFGRDCILPSEIIERIPPEQQELRRELLRARITINPTAKACNAVKCRSVANEAMRVLRKLDAIIDLFNKKITPKI